ncbi:MAG TPA: trypsin-like peptidase domain-containing protein [Pseudonocardia sp.]
MSDEQREHGRDEGPVASRTDQHPVPSYAGAPGSDAEQQHGATPAQQAPPPYSPYGSAAPWPPYGAAGGQATGQSPYFPPPPAGGTAVLETPGKPRGRTGIVVAALVAGLIGGGAAGAGTFALLDGPGGVPQLTQSAPASGASAATPGSIAAAAAKAMPSTVDIQVNLAQGSGEGSGVILSADGDVLTNNHVVAGSTGAITVTLADGSEHPATVVGTSPSYDLAVIKIQGVSGLTPATLGKSAGLQVGQQVVAIGSPQGLTGTVTNGIVSAFNRTVTVQGGDGSAVVYNGLQTDAPINPGNSGGPLVNLDGQVVGINSAIATASSGQGQGGSIGLGFAIPIDQATRVAQEIIKDGSATKPVLGVTGSVQQSGGSGSGARIATVQPGSPAASAGLAAGDVVTKVGDAKVEDFADLIARIGSNAPGSQVALTVQSGGASKSVQVTLGTQKDNAATTGTGGESQNPFGGRGGQSPFGGGSGGSGGSPFGN